MLMIKFSLSLCQIKCRLIIDVLYLTKLVVSHVIQWLRFLLVFISFPCRCEESFQTVHMLTDVWRCSCLLYQFLSSVLVWENLAVVLMTEKYVVRSLMAASQPSRSPCEWEFTVHRQQSKYVCESLKNPSAAKMCSCCLRYDMSLINNRFT